MARIRPISDLRNKSQEISRICHETGEPVFITKNGEGDLVVMSVAAYERDRTRLELYGLLAEVQAAARHAVPMSSSPTEAVSTMAPAGAEAAAPTESKLWTPDSEQAGGGGKLWTPD